MITNLPNNNIIIVDNVLNYAINNVFDIISFIIQFELDIIL